MKPIHDFEIIRCGLNGEPSKTGKSLAIQPSPPLRPRMRLVVDHPFYSLLAFRGAVVHHHRISESELVAQFEAECGYVLFIAETDSESSHFSELGIYYLLKDFSGAQFGTMVAWDGAYNAFERFMMMSAPVLSWGEDGPDPLKQIHVENSRRSVFEVAGLGWFRLTLHERQPRRYLCSSLSFNHKNSKFGDARYFSVRRLSNDDRIRYQTCKHSPADGAD